MKSMREQNPTLERIIPDSLAQSGEIDQQSLQLHYERYRFATKHVQPGRLLDIACGAGYGSHLLATTSDVVDSIVAVDVSAEAIGYAQQRYAHEKITFIQQDAFSFSSDRLFNTIISLETIEHLPDPKGFARKLSDWLLPGGVLIVSAPVTPSTDGNPFHVTDFSSSSFRKLFDGYGLKETGSLLQVQPYGFKSIFQKNDNQRTQHTRRNLAAFYFSHPAVFFLRMKSLLTDGFRNKYLTLALTKQS
jgi:cyclopropane fatty-acyl-phospholipid synthase-like methyltransferase